MFLTTLPSDSNHILSLSIAIIIPVVLGSITGFFGHLINNNYEFDYPRKLESGAGFYMGCLAHMGIGALAALAAVNLIIPDVDSVRSVVGISILSAIGGESFLLRNALHNEQKKSAVLLNVQNALDEELLLEDNAQPSSERGEANDTSQNP